MKYEIEIGSPPEYEELVVYIIIEGKYFCLLSKDKGIEKLEIHFFNESTFTIDYLELLEILNKAKSVLVT